MRKTIRVFTVLFIFAAFAEARQSITVATGSPSITLPNSAPWTTMGSSTQPSRWEMRLHGYNPSPVSRVFGPVFVPIGIQWGGGGTNMAAQTSFCCDTFHDNWVYLNNSLPSMTDIVVRVQRDVANNRYTLEVCDIQNVIGCFSETAAFFTYGPTSWAGKTVGLQNAGYDLAFLRWFSTTVPIGTPIPVVGVTGDVADWEFQGSATDSVHGLTFSGGTVSYVSTPVYAPACNPGPSQTFRAGTTGTLNGAGSYPLDGGATLHYLWQQLPNVSPVQVFWTNQTAVAPTVSGMLFGSYDFTLTVTDGGGQTSACTVHDGAVAQDGNGTVLTGNPMVDTLFGPMPALGQNSWPWMDDRAQFVAATQEYNIDHYYTDYWDTPSTHGTIDVTAGTLDVYGHSGSGTQFLTDFCQQPTTLSASAGTGDTTWTVASATSLYPGLYVTALTEGSNTTEVAYVTAVNGNVLSVNRAQMGTSASAHNSGASIVIPTPNTYMVRWWNSGNNRRMDNVTSCISNTHVTIDGSIYAGMSTIVLTESAVSYAMVNGSNSSVFTWQFGGNAQYPGNYYDNVAAFYGLYYRTGIDTYLNYARKLADLFWHAPTIDQGMVATSNPLTLWPQGSGYSLPGRGTSLMGLILRAADGHPEMWTGFRNFEGTDAYNFTSFSTWGAPGFYDEREQGYMIWRTALCGLYEPDATHKNACKTTLQSWLPTLSTAVANFGYAWPQWGAGGVASTGSSAHTGGNATYVTLQNGSSTVTLSGSTWNAGNFTQGTGGTGTQGWFFNCSSGFKSNCIAPLSNAGGDSSWYYLAYVDSTHATLTDASGNPVPYTGCSTSPCDKGYTILPGTSSTTMFLGWESQPFMVGIIGSSLYLASLALSDQNFDPASAATYATYARNTATWLKNTAYRSSTKGQYYFVGSVNCPAGATPESYTWCQGGGTPTNPEADRILSAEIVRALMFPWFSSTTPRDSSMSSYIDTIVDAQWAKPGTCPTGSSVCVSDGYYMPDYDPGGVWSTGVPPGNANPKWFGMPFGLNPQYSWAAMRIGGALPVTTQTVSIGFRLANVPHASHVVVTATAMNGTSTQTTCSSSPCAVSVGSGRGGVLVMLQYLSAAGKVLAASRVPLPAVI